MKTKISTLIMACIAVFICHSVSAQLSGTYTINSAAGTSGTNFNSFNALSSALSSDGVSGPVEVNVVPSSGPYYESVTFSQISGASATNTITINGNNESLISTSGTAACPLKLNGADYFIFEGIKLQSAVNGVGARCVQIYNEADYNIIRNCDLWISSYSGGDGSTAFIAFSPLAIGNRYGDHGKGNQIINNTMRGDTGNIGPVWGIYDSRYGFEDSSANTLIRGNDISGVKRYFIYQNYTNGVQIVSNRIHDPHQIDGTITAIYLQNCESSDLHEVIRIDSNEIYNMHGARVSTIEVFDVDGTASRPISVSHNYVHNCSATLFIYGFRIQRCKNFNLIGNSVRNCSASTTFSYAGANIRECENIVLKNWRVSNNYAPNNIGIVFTIYATDTVEIANCLVDSNSTDNNGLRVFQTYQGSAINIHSNEVTANFGPSLGFTDFRFTNGLTLENNLFHNNNCASEDAVVFTAGCLNVKVFHNTFHWRPSGNYENGLYLGNSDNRNGYEVKNNIVYIDSVVSTNYFRPIFAPNASDIEWDNNVYFLDNVNSTMYFTTSIQFSNFSDWASDADDTSSVLADPQFEDLANGDLRSTNPDIDNIATPGLVAVDFEGVTRSSTPDPGALEFDAITCNLGSSLISYPDSTNDVIGSLNTHAETNQMFISYGPQNMIIECKTTGGEDNSYSFSGDYLSEGSTDSSVVFSPAQPGVYTITCIVTSGDCADTSEIDICVIDATGDHPNNNSYKVKICHQPDDSSQNAVTISISINAVQTHLTGHDGCRLGGCSSSCNSSQTSDNVTDDDHSYILHGYEDMQVVVQPNPSTSSFNIFLSNDYDEDVMVEVYDITGKLLSSEIYNSTAFTLGSELPVGMYFLKIVQGNHVETIRLIKE